MEHARVFFGLASAYGGRAIGPGPLDISGALDAPCDLVSVAVSTAREGCVAETVSAQLIAAASDAAEDRAVRAALAIVADQEREHALLAWRFVRWALERGGEKVRRALAEVLQRSGEWVGFGARTTHRGSEEAMLAHGYLSIDQRRAIALDALRRVVEPAMQSLIGQEPATHAPC